MRRYSIELAENDGTMEMKRTVQARHVGSCPSGVAPGDLMDDAGKKIANTLG